jgi:excisionase family DNA binding protein
MLHDLDLDPLLSTGQLCRELGYGRTKVMNLIRLGKLPCVMDGNRIRVRRSVVRAFMDSLPKGYTAGAPVKAVRHG